MSNSNENSDYTQTLPQLIFFQGDTIVIPIEWYKNNGDPIDLSTATVGWDLAPYGIYGTPVLSYLSTDLNSNITFDSVSNNLCYINIPTTDSTLLSDGQYTQQPYLTIANKKYLRAEGTIVFRREINS